jgi:hypothetical protein
LPLNHLPGENRRTEARIGEVRLGRLLCISIPTVCMGLFRYAGWDYCPVAPRCCAWVCLWGSKALLVRERASVSGSTPAEVLKLLLGLILIAATLKAFWRHQ